jgi:hypothetical protein
MSTNTKLILEFYLADGSTKSCVFTIKGGREIFEHAQLRPELIPEVEKRVWLVAFSLGIKEDDVEDWELVLPSAVVHAWCRPRD